MDNDERIRRWREEREKTGGSRTAGDTGPVVAPADRDDSPGLAGDFAASGPQDAESIAVRETILERRRARFRTIARNIAIFVGVPLVAVLLYAGLIATPLYKSEAVFTVQTTSQAAPAPTAGIFAVGSAGSTIADAFKAREYILSRPMMDYMEERHGFLSHFSTSAMDPLTRYDSPLGINGEAHEYYRRRVEVAVDVQEGILRLYVHARSRQDAVRFASAILQSAEQHVRDLSQKMSNDQINSLTQDVRQAELGVQQSRRALAAVQARRGELSPEQTATAIYQLVSQLQLQLAEAQRQRNSLLEQGLTNSPLLPRLNAQIAELRAQIADQRGRLVTPSGGSLQRALSDVESATGNKEIAQARYQSALNTLEQAYLRILEQRRYFLTIVPPSAGNSAKVRDMLLIAGPVLLLLALIYALLFALSRFGPERMRTTEVFRRWRDR